MSGQSAQGGGNDVSRTKRPPLPRRGKARHLILLGAESTPGPQRGRRDKIT
jgi:hypothetical protein